MEVFSAPEQRRELLILAVQGEEDYHQCFTLYPPKIKITREFGFLGLNDSWQLQVECKLEVGIRPFFSKDRGVVSARRKCDGGLIGLSRSSVILTGSY